MKLVTVETNVAEPKTPASKKRASETAKEKEERVLKRLRRKLARAKSKAMHVAEIAAQLTAIRNSLATASQKKGSSQKCVPG